MNEVEWYRNSPQNADPLLRSSKLKPLKYNINKLLSEF